MKDSEKINLLRLSNPYPKDIFPYTKPSILNFIFHKDKVMGTWGRTVWDSCILRLLDIYLQEV